MRVKFWGVRGSIPAPVDSATIKNKIVRALSGAGDVNLGDPQAVAAYVDQLPLETAGTSGGNTPCVEVRTGEHLLIFDAGSGLRQLGIELMRGDFGRGRGVAHMFISHTHWDHIQGFPFFLPAYVPGNRFYIYSPKKDVQERFTIQQIDQDMFPMRLDDMGADIQFVTIPKEGLKIDDLKVDAVVLHHPGGSWAYRVRSRNKTLVYATDGEYQNLSDTALKPYLDFFHQADALIFDAMYTFSESVTKEGWGHSTSLVGVDMAVKTKVKKLVLFHHEPTYNDDKLQDILSKTEQYYSLVRKQEGLDIILAIEGETIEV